MLPKTKLIIAGSGAGTLVAFVIFCLWFFWDKITGGGSEVAPKPDQQKTGLEKQGDKAPDQQKTSPEEYKAFDKLLEASTPDTKLMDLAAVILTDKGQNTKYLKAFFETIDENFFWGYNLVHQMDPPPGAEQLEAAFAKAYDTLETPDGFFSKIFRFLAIYYKTACFLGDDGKASEAKIAKYPSGVRPVLEELFKSGGEGFGKAPNNVVTDIQGLHMKHANFLSPIYTSVGKGVPP